MSGHLRLAVILVLALAVRAFAQDVAIELKGFGFGDHFRPGDWTAAQFVVTLRSGDPRTVQLVWEVENADGDIEEHVRTLVVNPGAPSTRWLSAKLAPRVDNNTVFTVRVYEDDDGQRGRELAGARISPSSVRPPAVQVQLEESLIAVLGRYPMNLDGYSVLLDGATSPPAMNETTRIVRGLDARNFPDRWEGLSSCEAIVWGDSPPQSLELEESEALREYLRRGGHLIIVLPQGGNPWALGAAGSHQLHDLLPQVAPRRIEAVKVRELMPILSKAEGLRRPEAETTINVFDPATLDRGWEPLVALPSRRDPLTGLLVRSVDPADVLDGAVVAIQRRVGFGRMTIVGIDLPGLAELQVGGLPQPDAFWNRILGRRGDTPTVSDLKVLESAQPRRLFGGRSTTLNLGGGELIAGQIGMSGQAALGLLAAVGVFLAYWAIAGPISFAALKKSGRVRHSWLAFVAVGVAFTLVSWAGGSLLRQRSVRVQHVTVIDHLARTPGAPESEEPQFQRAVSWFSVYLPGYGGSDIGIESEKGQRDLLASWISPPGAMSQRFPNIDRYPVPYSSPNEFHMPSRATATTLEARWLGPVSDSIGGVPQATAPIREVLMRGGSPSAAVQGVLTHSLRTTLEDVQVIYISSFRTPLRRMVAASGPGSAEPAVPGEMLNFGRMATVRTWDAGQPLDLAAVFGFDKAPMPIPDPRQQRTSLPGTLRLLFGDDFEAELGLGGTLSLTPTTRTKLEHALGLFNMLPPPRWLEDQSGKVPLRFHRQMARELDLSTWFSRPCVIIAGFMREEGSAKMPIPLFVDGASPPASGVTVVRWICPLPLQDDLVVPDERSAMPRTTPEKSTPPDSDVETPDE